MKYSAKSIVLLLILLFVFCAGGCKDKEVDERTLSVFELEFSDEAVEELEVAYKKLTLEHATFDISANTLEKLWEDMKPGPDRGRLVYYGTFDDCVVWFIELATQAETNFELAGSQFYYHSSCTFFVCREQKLITLQEAYEQGFISAEDIAIVAARHAEYNAE